MKGFKYSRIMMVRSTDDIIEKSEQLFIKLWLPTFWRSSGSYFELHVKFCAMSFKRKKKTLARIIKDNFERNPLFCWWFGSQRIFLHSRRVVSSGRFWKLFNGNIIIPKRLVRINSILIGFNFNFSNETYNYTKSALWFPQQ